MINLLRMEARIMFHEKGLTDESLLTCGQRIILA